MSEIKGCTPKSMVSEIGNRRLQNSAGPMIQPELPGFVVDEFARAIKAKIVKKVGTRDYWEDWASNIADIANASESSYAGAITAALFLKEFVPAGILWGHFDLMAWNLKTQPGRPEGGEAMGLRAVFSWLEQRLGGR